MFSMTRSASAPSGTFSTVITSTPGTFFFMTWMPSAWAWLYPPSVTEPMCTTPTLSPAAVAGEAAADSRTTPLSSAASALVAFMRWLPFSCSPLWRGLEDPAQARRRGMPARAAPAHQHGQTEKIRQHVQKERRDRQPARLEQELQRDGATEQGRAADRPDRLPLGEDHQRHRDEPAPRRHPLGPRAGDPDRERGAGDAAEHPRDGEGLVLDGPGIATRCERGRGVLPHGAQPKAPS